jgi:hypothetical protein
MIPAYIHELLGQHEGSFYYRQHVEVIPFPISLTVMSDEFSMKTNFHEEATKQTKSLVAIDMQTSTRYLIPVGSIAEIIPNRFYLCHYVQDQITVFLVTGSFKIHRHTEEELSSDSCAANSSEEINSKLLHVNDTIEIFEALSDTVPLRKFQLHSLRIMQIVIPRINDANEYEQIDTAMHQLAEQMHFGAVDFCFHTYKWQIVVPNSISGGQLTIESLRLDPMKKAFPLVTFLDTVKTLLDPWLRREGLSNFSLHSMHHRPARLEMLQHTLHSQLPADILTLATREYSVRIISDVNYHSYRCQPVHTTMTALHSHPPSNAIMNTFLDIDMNIRTKHDYWGKMHAILGEKVQEYVKYLLRLPWKVYMHPACLGPRCSKVPAPWNALPESCWNHIFSYLTYFGEEVNFMTMYIRGQPNYNTPYIRRYLNELTRLKSWESALRAKRRIEEEDKQEEGKEVKDNENDEEEEMKTGRGSRKKRRRG